MSNVMAKESSDRQVQRLSSLNLCDVEQQARALVEQARDTARRMLADAAAKAREVEQMAAARGQRAGYQEGLKRGAEEGRTQAMQAETERIRKDTDTVRKALIAALSELESHHHALLGEARRDLLALALAVAQRVCRRSLADDNSHLQTLLEEVIEISGRSHGLILRVNPADAAAVTCYLADLHIKVIDADEAGGPGGSGGSAAASSDGAVVCLQCDENITRGGCLAEHRHGRVDARIETQMERLADELLGEDAATTLGDPSPQAAECLDRALSENSDKSIPQEAVIK